MKLILYGSRMGGVMYLWHTETIIWAMCPCIDGTSRNRNFTQILTLPTMRVWGDMFSIHFLKRNIIDRNVCIDSCPEIVKNTINHIFNWEDGRCRKSDMINSFPNAWVANSNNPTYFGMLLTFRRIIRLATKAETCVKCGNDCYYGMQWFKPWTIISNPF